MFRDQFQVPAFCRNFLFFFNGHCSHDAVVRRGASSEHFFGILALRLTTACTTQKILVRQVAVPDLFLKKGHWMLDGVVWICCDTWYMFQCIFTIDSFESIHCVAECCQGSGKIRLPG